MPDSTPARSARLLTALVLTTSLAAGGFMLGGLLGNALSSDTGMGQLADALAGMFVGAVAGILLAVWLANRLHHRRLRAVATGSTACALLLVGFVMARNRTDDSLIFTIEQALATAPTGASLDRSVPGDWDRLCIVSPAAHDAVLDSLLGFVWRDAPAGAAEETHTLLLFAQGDHVLHPVAYPLARARFQPLDYCVERQRAVFIVDHAGTGPLVRPREPPRGPAGQSSSQ